MQRCQGLQNHQLRAGPFTVAETVHDRGLQLPRHTHDTACLHIVLAGVYQESTPGDVRNHGPRSVLFKPAGELHWNHFRDAASRTLRIELDGALRLPGPALGPTHSRAPELGELGHRIHIELHHADDLTPLAVEGLCAELLARLARCPRARRSSSRVELVERAARMLRERCGESLSFGRLARDLGVNRSHLARSFREVHRCTMGEFLRHERVERVRRALRESNRPLADIALEAGFSDQSHCTRSFRRALGISPAEYRRSHR